MTIQTSQNNSTPTRLSEIDRMYAQDAPHSDHELQRLRRMRNDIDAEVADMTRTVLRIAEQSAQGWLDPRIDLIDADIQRWQAAFDQVIERIRTLKTVQTVQAPLTQRQSA